MKMELETFLHEIRIFLREHSDGSLALRNVKFFKEGYDAADRGRGEWISSISN